MLSPRGTLRGSAPIDGGARTVRGETRPHPAHNGPNKKETPSDLRFRRSEGVYLHVAAPGFEPGKAEPADLQRAPSAFDHLRFFLR